MYIELFDRYDRLGSNIFNYIFQIFFAHYNNYYIKYSRNLKYNNSIFVQYLFDYIDEYNKDKINDNIKTIIPNEYNDDYYNAMFNLTNILKLINSDLFSYFKCHIFNNIKYNQMTKKYNIPFNPNKTILIHLRLEDTKAIIDYDGRICSNFFKEYINNDEPNYKKLIHPFLDIQSPLSTEKILNQIEIVSLKYPNYRKIIITNPGEKHEFPYEYIQSDDPSYDLFLLTQCKVVILSRSTFALSSLFFGNHTDVYLPVWGQTACMGLGTKYDKSNFNYFY